MAEKRWRSAVEGVTGRYGSERRGGGEAAGAVGKGVRAGGKWGGNQGRGHSNVKQR